jgi:PHD/YefM family antitoxin component YafN of YafNO toxin-antitoxin module
MTNATLELYHALVEAGVSKESAEAAAKTVITRQEAKDVLVTKAEMYKAMMIQTGVTISSIGVLMALFTLMG